MCKVNNGWRDKRMKMPDGKCDQKGGLSLGSVTWQESDRSSGDTNWKARGGKSWNRVTAEEAGGGLA